MKLVSGVQFYDGPSAIDGEQIIAIGTFRTSNPKTGLLLQTWIMRKDENPVQAANLGLDSSICGDCPMRGILAPSADKRKNGAIVNRQRSCYVRLDAAPGNVYAAWERGNYPHIDDLHEIPRHFQGHGLRYGSYGDPVAVPWGAWAEIEQYCVNRAVPGYTHQWKKRKFQCWRSYVMASTHSLAEKNQAKEMGWRSFRTIKDESELDFDEILCPASKEGGYRLTCERCNMCNGNRNDNAMTAKHIAIVGHGSMAVLPSLHNLINRQNLVELAV